MSLALSSQATAAVKWNNPSKKQEASNGSPFKFDQYKKEEWFELGEDFGFGLWFQQSLGRNFQEWGATVTTGHLTWWSPFQCSSDGLSNLQLAMAIGHRVWNRQPEGGFSGEGSSPFNACSSDRVVSSVGTSASRALVYGCWGFSSNCLVSPISTICPRYITATLSATCSMTLMSWLMNR